MKKLLSLVVALIFVVTMALGCAGLGTIKAEDPQSIQVLLKKVDKCKADEEGFACVSIPLKDKNIPEGQVPTYLTVYKAKDQYGFGVYSQNGFVIWFYDTKEKKWFYVRNEMGGPQSEEQVAKAWAKWVDLYKTKYNPNEAFCGMADKEPEGKNTESVLFGESQPILARVISGRALMRP